MSFTLNKSIIKEVCGETSYKRGEAYYKANKVIVNHYDETKRNLRGDGKRERRFSCYSRKS